MHPAARVFTIAVVIVLISSQLVLNVMTEKPAFMVSRQTVQRAVQFGGQEGVNDAVVEKPINDAAAEKQMKTLDMIDEAMKKSAKIRDEEIGGEDTVDEEDGGEEISETAVARDAEVAKEPVEADVEEDTKGEKQVDTAVEGAVRKDDGEDCDGDGDGDGGGEE